MPPCDGQKIRNATGNEMSDDVRMSCVRCGLHATRNANGKGTTCDVKLNDERRARGGLGTRNATEGETCDDVRVLCVRCCLHAIRNATGYEPPDDVKTSCEGRAHGGLETRNATEYVMRIDAKKNDESRVYGERDGRSQIETENRDEDVYRAESLSDQHARDN